MPLLGDGSEGPRLLFVKYHATRRNDSRDSIFGSKAAYTTDLYNFSPSRSMRGSYESKSNPKFDLPSMRTTSQTASRTISKDLDAVRIRSMPMGSQVATEHRHSDPGQGPSAVPRGSSDNSHAPTEPHVVMSTTQNSVFEHPHAADNQSVEVFPSTYAGL